MSRKAVVPKTPFVRRKFNGWTTCSMKTSTHEMLLLLQVEMQHQKQRRISQWEVLDILVTERLDEMTR